MPDDDPTANPDGPTPRSAATRPRLDIEHLFGDQRPFSQCHATTLVALEGGGLLAAWFAGTREGHDDVAIWAARRNPAPTEAGGGSFLNTRWSEPTRIAKVSDEPHWNPVLFALSPGGRDLVLHFKVGRRIRRWTTWSQRSRDGGQTWQEARPLVPGDRGGRGAVRNKPIRLASGDWLAGASIERWRRWDAFFDRSASGEEDWTATQLVEIDRREFVGKGLIQPTLWESRPGCVHALFRSTDGRVHRADSNDDGLTWSRAYAIALPNNNSGLDLARLPDGTLALACNPVQGNWAARTPLCVLLSRDNGQSWPGQIDVETAPGEFSYPAIIAHGNDLALSYTWNRRRIAFVHIPHAQIASR
ncbi:MAG: exo-alpha-sialidase [bacterium]|nr:neuraminidase (sialidase) [Deltaproteobacteria bacterium]MCP4904645.1 exo-alpha-sialidase [bacterium]